MSQETRIAALERLGRRLNAKHSPLHILLVSGGLPGPINWAYAGQHRWRREADETLDVFAERAACAACAAGETSW
jgi:hypothetical protein